jgi:hypothetical protein
MPSIRGIAEVHEDDVRPQVQDEPHALLAVAGLTDDVDARQLEDETESLADELLVVDQQRRRHGVPGRSSGSRPVRA